MATHDSPSSSHPASPSPQARLIALLRAERRDLWILVIYGLVIGLLTLVVPFAVQALVNTAGFGTLIQPLLVLAGLVFVGLGFSAAVQAVQAHVIEMIQRRLFVRTALDLAGRFPRVRQEAFDQYHGPELVNRFFDVLTVQKSASILLLDGLSIIIQAVIGLTLVALYHPALLVYSVLVALSLMAIVRVLGTRGVRTAVEESKAKYAVAAWLEEVARHPVTFKSAGGPVLALDRVDALLERYLDYRNQHFQVVFRQFLGILLLYMLASSVLLGLGGWLVILQQLSLGQLVAAEFIVTVIVGGFAKFGKQLETFYDLLAAVDKLGQLTDLPLEHEAPGALPATDRPMAVALRDVVLAYPAGPPVLAGLDLELHPGEAVGIVGAHGAGKTTLLEALFGLRLPEAGTITLDGVTMRELNLMRLRAEIELVREIELFDGTVLENVRMGRPKVDESAVRRALAAVNLLDRINDLPEGLHTRLMVAGAPLSPGEARRLVLARSIAGRPRLLLLDEALGHLDQASQASVLEAVFAEEAPWTVVASTYNRQALARCDRIFELRDGRLHEVTLADFSGEAGGTP